MWGLEHNSIFACRCWVVPAKFVEKTSLPSIELDFFVKNQLRISYGSIPISSILCPCPQQHNIVMITVVFSETLISGRIIPLPYFICFFVKTTLDTQEPVPFQFSFRKNKQLCLMFDRHCFQPIDTLEEKWHLSYVEYFSSWI